MTFRPARTPQLVAHMGDSSRYPANTLAAVESAIDHGIDMVEIDVSVTADGVLAAMHGPRLDHWTDGRGRVHRVPWGSVRELRARHGNKGLVSEERVPAVADVLDLVAGRVPLNLDIKRASAIPAAIAAMDARRQDFVVSGLSPRQVRRELRRHPGVSLLVNLTRFDKLVARSRRFRTRWLCRASQRRLFAHPDVIALNLNKDWVDQELVAATHAAGAQVWVFTAHTTDELVVAVNAGADSITVDDAATVLPG